MLTPKEALMLPAASSARVGDNLPGHQHCVAERYSPSKRYSQYKYLANSSVREAAMVYRGHQGRLRMAMDR